MQIATGTYVGDDTDGRVIPTGLSGALLRADIAFVDDGVGDSGVGMKIAGMPAGAFVDYIQGNVHTDGFGFLGTSLVVSKTGASIDTTLNSSGVVYTWVAWSE